MWGYMKYLGLNLDKLSTEHAPYLLCCISSPQKTTLLNDLELMFCSEMASPFNIYKI